MFPCLQNKIMCIKKDGNSNIKRIVKSNQLIYCILDVAKYRDDNNDEEHTKMVNYGKQNVHHDDSFHLASYILTLP